MKQIIVLAAFIALGIFISSVVIGFEEDVQGIDDKITPAITKISENISASNIATTE